MTKNRDYLLYLQDMLTSMERIEMYIGDKGFSDFENDSLLIDAIVRNFEVIGEAANHVPEEIKENYHEMPWDKMYGLRNLIAHEYFGIDHQLLWQIAKNNLPENKSLLKEIIRKETRS